MVIMFNGKCGDVYFSPFHPAIAIWRCTSDKYKPQDINKQDDKNKKQKYRQSAIVNCGLNEENQENRYTNYWTDHITRINYFRMCFWLHYLNLTIDIQFTS